MLATGEGTLASDTVRGGGGIRVFHQLVTPVAESLGLSFLVASTPIVVVLVLLGVVRRPAWQAALAGLITALAIAVLVWKLPLGLALDSAAAGATYGLWPVMWVVFNALVVYNIAVASGHFDAFRVWLIDNLPNDRRVVLVVIGFSFSALLEGVAGFGTPIAITSALLIGLGFPVIEALTFTLIFNTVPVAFGGLGTPVTTLGAVTQLSSQDLGAMIGRQLPVLAMLLPFYVIVLYSGARSLRRLWPVLTVAGGSFALAQFVTSNYIAYELTDIVASLTSLISTILFLKVWHLEPDPAFALTMPAANAKQAAAIPPWHGLVPWILVAAVVTAWTLLGVNLKGQSSISWPGLHNQIFITLYDKPYAAIWLFQPLATGTAILVAAVIIAGLCRVGPGAFLKAMYATFSQIRLATLTVALIIGLAYLMNYSGMTYTLGVGVASAGMFFPLLSAFLGWVAVFLTGSDTSGNALFGNLQVVAARQLDLSPVLMAATNSSGGVMGKMISPQNICTGTAVTELKGREGQVLARTFVHSIVLTLLLGLIVLMQQYLFPWMIPK